MRSKLIALLALAACGGTPNPKDLTGGLSVRIIQAPADAQCVVVSVYSGTRNAFRTVPLTAGQSTVESFNGLPTGTVLAEASAYNLACTSVTVPPSSSQTPTWVSNQVSATITPGAVASVTLVLTRNGQATVGLDFQDDGRLTATLAGGGATGASDGIGAAARFNGPRGVAADNAGNLYIADTGNHLIRKLVIATLAVSTIAGSAGVAGYANGVGTAATFTSPRSLAYDGAGNLYVAEACDVRRIALATATVTTLAGSGTGCPQASTDGTGTAATFGAALTHVWDGAGNLYVTDSYSIRKIVAATGVVTTLIGSNNRGGFVDGAGAAARFTGLGGIGWDGALLYVADGNAVRTVSLSPASVTTIAGSATCANAQNGTGSSACLAQPAQLAADSAGNLFVAGQNDQAIRRVVLSTGTIVTVEGVLGQSGAADGVGSASRFSLPNAVALDNAGVAYVADTGNNAIRRF